MTQRPEIESWLSNFPYKWTPCPTAGEHLWYAEPDTGRGYVTQTCASTMDLAWTLHRSAVFPEMSWVLAMDQTRGRGQFGRTWDSAQGNLFATLRLPDKAGDAGPMLPLAVALVLADELAAGSLIPEIKWPNDILLGRKKAGGILIEQRQGRIMAGIGINVKTVPGTSIKSGGTPEPGYKIGACSLEEFGFSQDAPALWHRLAKRFNHSLMALLSAPGNLKLKVEKALAFKGESVVLKHNGRTRLVRITGIDDQGRLVVETSGAREAVGSGQIIPRTII